MEQTRDLNDFAVDCYDELRRLAAAYLRGERRDHTLQPTALVHEAFLRLVRMKRILWSDRAHVLGVAAFAMRQVLVGYARSRARLKRGGPNATRLSLDEAIDLAQRQELDLSAVDEALKRLEAIDARQAAVVEMRFFGGLTLDQVATALRLSRATVKRDWATAKLWLHGELCD